MLAIATLAAVVVAAGAGRSADAGSDSDPLPEVNLERLIGDPPSGYRYAESPTAERRHVRRMLAAPGAKGFFMRDIVSGGRVAGVVVVVTASIDGSEEDVRRGMEDSTGRRATTTTLGDERILAVRVPGQVHQVVRVDRRAFAMVLVFPRYPTWKLARAILTG